MIPPSSTHRFLLVEDKLTFRELLKVALVAKFAPQECVEAGSVREGLAALAGLPFDLLISDLYLPDGDGREIVRHALALPKPPACLVLTGQPDRNLAGDLLSLGVAGFVDKGSPLEHVLQAAARVLAGGVFFSTHMPPPKQPAASALPSDARPAGPGVEVLTPREREIARFVAIGATSKEVGARLDISPRTVEKHRAELMRKLGLRDVASLARWALQQRLS